MKKRLLYGAGVLAVLALGGFALKQEGLILNNNHVKSIKQISDFDRPFCVSQDAEGLLYVCDFTPHQVKIYNQDGQPVKQIGTAGSGDGEFNMPHAVDFDSDGNIYVNDYGNKRVQKFDPTGKFLEVLSSPRLKGPATSYFDKKKENIYVSDYGSDSLLKFSKNFDFLGFVGMTTEDRLTNGWSQAGEPAKSTEPGGFDRVHSAKVDQDGTIYVVDTWNHRIQRFSKEGMFTGWIGAYHDGTLTNGWKTSGQSWSTTTPGGFNAPVALEIVGDELVVLEYENPRVQKFSKKTGKFIGWFGGKQPGGVTDGWQQEGFAREGSEPGAIILAYDLKVYGNKLYIADTGNHRVQIIEFAGKI